MDRNYQVAVVGLGGIGAAAAHWLARSGRAVIGFEQFELFHTRGASQDHSRIIRKAQHEEPYASLMPAAYQAWADVEEEAGLTLLVETGGLVIEDGRARADLDTGNRNIAGYLQMFQRHRVEYEQLTAAETQKRWPQFRLEGHEEVLFQRETGIVDAAKANAVHVALARSRGAQLCEQTPVRALRPTPAGIEVVTDAQTYLVQHVVTAADGWTNQVLPAGTAPIPLMTTQEQVTYYATPNLAEFSPSRFPVFMWHGFHNFYGFPIFGEVATKLGQHLGGHRVTVTDRTFEPDVQRIDRQRAFLDRHVPGFRGPELYTKTCLYTIPPDQHFVLGPLPAEPRITVFIGAGHAYKFASLMGRILAELATTGRTEHPVDSFDLRRPALTDPTFVARYHR